MSKTVKAFQSDRTLQMAFKEAAEQASQFLSVYKTLQTKVEEVDTSDKSDNCDDEHEGDVDAEVHDASRLLQQSSCKLLQTLVQSVDNLPDDWVVEEVVEQYLSGPRQYNIPESRLDEAMSSIRAVRAHYTEIEKKFSKKKNTDM